MKKKFKNILPAIIFFIIFIVIWQILCSVLSIQEFLLPTPISIIINLYSDILSLCYHTLVTLFEALIGFLIANLIAFLLAVLMNFIPKAEKAIMPFAITLKTTPIVAMAPLLLLWFGTGIWPKVASAALICFFPVLVSTIKGFYALQQDEEDLFNVYGASKLEILLKLRIRRAAPFIFSALRVSSSLSIVGAIVGEFVGANSGIGYIILVSSYHLETVRMFAALTVTSIAGVIFYYVLKKIDEKTVFWLPSIDKDAKLESPRLEIDRSYLK